MNSVPEVVRFLIAIIIKTYGDRKGGKFWHWGDPNLLIRGGIIPPSLD